MSAEGESALLDALEAITTACEWLGQREAHLATTNSEAAIFQRLSNVAARIEGWAALTAETGGRNEGS